MTAMLHDHNRLVFALNVLEGEEGAHLILADMLEEAGEHALAEFSRAQKGSRHKRLDFVLAILPHRVTLGVVCEFLVHSLSFIDGHDSPDHLEPNSRGSMIPLVKAINGIGDWASSGSSDNDLSDHVATIGAVGPWAHGVQGIDTTMQTLHLAVTCAKIAESSAESEARHAEQSAGASSDACRKVAKAAREMPKPLMASLRWEQRYRNLARGVTDKLKNNLATWQADYTREVIFDLLQQQDDDA